MVNLKNGKCGFWYSKGNHKRINDIATVGIKAQVDAQISLCSQLMQQIGRLSKTALKELHTKVSLDRTQQNGA